MSRTITAEFKSRRDAEMAVEHIVQEHGLNRNAVTIGSATAENTAGTEPARADVEDGHVKSGTEGEPKLAGKVEVTVEVDEGYADKVESSLKTFEGDTAT